MQQVLIAIDVFCELIQKCSSCTRRVFADQIHDVGIVVGEIKMHGFIERDIDRQQFH